MTICYVSRHYAAESGNLGTGTYADPYRPVTNPAVLTWLSGAPAGSVLCSIDALIGNTGVLFLDPADMRTAATPGRPLIISGDPARWGDAPAGAMRSQRFGFKSISPTFVPVGATGIYGATITGLNPRFGLTHNIDLRSDRGGTAQRDAGYERPTLVFHPQDCWAVPHTCCRTHKVTVGAVADGNTVVITYSGSQALTLTAKDVGADIVNSPGAAQFVRTATPSITAANLAAVVNRSQPLTIQVTDVFAAGVRAAFWTTGAGIIADNSKCGAGSTFTLEIADVAHGVWKTGQAKSSAQLRLKLRLDSASAITDGNSLRLELAKNATTGETFGLWLSRSGATYKLGANTSAVTVAQDATITLDTALIVEARYCADRGEWWLWIDGAEVASGVAGTGPLNITDVGVKSVAGTGAATQWRVYLDDVRLWYEDIAKPNLKHASAWVDGAVAYFPQLYGDTSTLTIGANFTVVSDTWLVHLTGEADASARIWYAADASGNGTVDIAVRTLEEQASDVVTSDVDIISPYHLVNGIGAAFAGGLYGYERMWSYRVLLAKPNGLVTIVAKDIIFDRCTWFDMLDSGPYLMGSQPSFDVGIPAYTYSQYFTANISTGVRIVDSQIVFASGLWNAYSLTSPNIDAHAIGLQTSRDVQIENVQARGTADLCFWYGPAQHKYPLNMCAVHRPDIAGEDRTFWLDTGRTMHRVTGALKYYWHEDMHRRVGGNERLTGGQFGITMENDGGPCDLDLYGIFVQGWPFGAPTTALRLGPALSGITPGAYGARVRGLGALFTGGLRLGIECPQNSYPFHFYDTAHPDLPRTPARNGTEQRKRSGAAWLGLLESTTAKSATKLAVAFTPGAPILAASISAAGALKLWLRKTGSPGDITVSIGAGTTPDVALTAASHTATITAASVSALAAGAEFSVTLTGSGDLAAGVKHWLIVSVAAASASAYYQMFGWWGGRYPAFPLSDYRANIAPFWDVEKADFSPYFTLATLGHAPASDFAAHVFALGSASSNARVAQRFRPSSTFTVSGLSVWLAKHNNNLGATAVPAAIYSDSGGSPGTLIAEFLDVRTNIQGLPAWVTHEAGSAAYAFPPSALVLTAATDYWLVIDAPVIDAGNYYRIFGCTDGAADGYGAKVWNGAAWGWLDGTVQSGAKLYFTLWAAPVGAAALPALPAASVDDVMVVSPRPVRNLYGTWDADTGVLAGITVTAAISPVIAVGLSGNSKAGGSVFDDWVLTDDFDAARPVIRGLMSIGKSPAFDAGVTYQAIAADPWNASGGTTGLFRYQNFELAASLASGENHHGQLTPAQWAERAGAAGFEFGRDLMRLSGA